MVQSEKNANQMETAREKKESRYNWCETRAATAPNGKLTGRGVEKNLTTMPSCS